MTAIFISCGSCVALVMLGYGLGVIYYRIKDSMKKEA